jgi:rhodanese-related sulfurtransferase
MTTRIRLNDPVKAKEYFEAKMAFTTGPVELERMIKTGEVNVVDVRADEDYKEGHVPGAINLPKTEWNSLKGLRRDKTNILYCYSQVCHLAAAAAVEFSGMGYPVMKLEGGFDEWKEHGLKIEIKAEEMKLLDSSVVEKHFATDES